MERERKGKPVIGDRDGQDTGKKDEREDFEQLAIMVAATARSAAGFTGKLLPGEKPVTPERWISNLAEGYCRDRPERREQAIEAIRHAFKTKYGVTPEVYLERGRDEKAADGERENPSEFIEMVSGPKLEYSWIAEVTLDPTPEGLEGGRVRYFNLTRSNDAPVPEAPDVRDQDKYAEWVEKAPPRDIAVARYEDGKLTVDRNNPHAADIIDEIKNRAPEMAMGAQRESGRSASDPAKARAIEKAARREAARTHDREDGRDR